MTSHGGLTAIDSYENDDHEENRVSGKAHEKKNQKTAPRKHKQSRPIPKDYYLIGRLVGEC
jgi:hypothetical protein